MTPNNTPKEEWEEEFIETAAAMEHERWANWQKYCHAKILENGGIIPKPYPFTHWERQIATSYEELSELEKESDRNEVRKYLSLIRSLLASQRASDLARIENLIEKKIEVYEEIIERADKKLFHDENDEWKNMKTRNVGKIAAVEELFTIIRSVLGEKK